MSTGDRCVRWVEKHPWARNLISGVFSLAFIVGLVIVVIVGAFILASAIVGAPEVLEHLRGLIFGGLAFGIGHEVGGRIAG